MSTRRTAEYLIKQPKHVAVPELLNLAPQCDFLLKVAENLADTRALRCLEGKTSSNPLPPLVRYRKSSTPLGIWERGHGTAEDCVGDKSVGYVTPLAASRKNLQ